MAVSVVFQKWVTNLTKGSVTGSGWDDPAESYKALLLRSTFDNVTLDATAIDTFDFLNDVPAADRAVAPSKAIQISNIVVSSATAGTNGKVFYGKQQTITFTTVATGQRVNGIVIFRSATTQTTSSHLVCYNDFVSPVTTDGGSVTVTLNANGLWQASY